MGGCAAINCSNHSRKGHRLTKFPKNEERRRIWTNNCRRKNWKPGPGAALCHDHFEESQFESSCKDWKKLRKTAVPTLFNISNPPPSVTDKRTKGCRNAQLGEHQMDHFEESQFESSCKDGKKLRKTAVPTLFNISNPPPSVTDKRTKSCRNAQLGENQMSLKMDDSLAPGSAHIIRMIPVKSKDNKELEQNNESETKSMYEEDEEINTYEEDKVIDVHKEDEEIDMQEDNEKIDIHEEDEELDEHEDEETSEDETYNEKIDIHEEDEETNEHEDEKHDRLLEKGVDEKIPDSEFATYLVCEANQVLPDLSHNYSGILTNNLHLKEASNINNIIHPTSLMSNIVYQVESKIEKESKELDMMYKISLLERKIEKIHEQCKEDTRKIKTLLQSQRRNMKTIAALKESITVLKKQNYIANTKTAILKEASPFLVDLLSRRKMQNKKVFLSNIL